MLAHLYIDIQLDKVQKSIIWSIDLDLCSMTLKLNKVCDITLINVHKSMMMMMRLKAETTFCLNKKKTFKFDF